MKLQLLFPAFLLVALLWTNSLVFTQALQDAAKPPSGSSNQPLANKAKFFNIDFYYRDEEGKKIPLTLHLKTFAIRLREGVKKEDFTDLFKGDARVDGFIDRSDLNLLIAQVRREYQSEKLLLETINEFNTSSPMVQFATPIVQTQGKMLALTDEFSVKFKSFVLPEEMIGLFKKHQLERLNVEKENNKYERFILQLTPATDKNVLQMVHIYEENDLVKHAEPRFLSLPKPLVVKTQLNTSVVNLGDPVLYQLEIIRDPNIQIEESLLLTGSINLKPSNLDPKAFKISDDMDNPPEVESKTEEGQIVMVKNYYLTFYGVGEYEIPPITIIYTKKVDLAQQPIETQEVKTDPIRIKVVSLLPRRVKDINGIVPESFSKGLEDASKRLAYRHLLLGSGVVVLSLVGLFLWLYTRAKQDTGKSLIEFSGKEKAISELEKLKESMRKALAEQRIGNGTPASDSQLQVPSSLLYEQVPIFFRRALGFFYDFHAESGSTVRVLKQLESLSVDDSIRKASQLILQEYGDKRFLPKNHIPVPTQTEVEKILSTVQEVEKYFKNR
jgi:hypothetical protein